MPFAPLLPSPARARRAAVVLAVALAAVAPACHRPGAAKPDDPGLIELAATPSTTLVLADQPGQMAVRVKIMAATPPAQGHGPVNLVLVLDTSGSMEGDAIASTRDAAQALVDRMADGDRLSIVVFHSLGEVLVPSIRLGDVSRKKIRTAIAGLAARGTTDLASGWSLALAQLIAGRSERTLNRMVLVTDGIPNDVSPVAELIAQTQALQVPITPLCLDVECEPTLLGQIAVQTGGSYKYLDDATAVAAVFDSEVLRLHQLVARDVRLVLKAGPGVILDATLLGDAIAGGGRSLALGDLAAGEERELVIPVTVPARRVGAVVEVLDAFLAFDDVVNHSGRRQRHGYVGVKTSGELAAIEAATEMDIETAMHRAHAATAMLQAIELGRRGDLVAANEVLDRGAAAARVRATAKDDAELAGQAGRMDALKLELPALFVQAAQQGGGEGRQGAGAAVSPSPVAVEGHATVGERPAGGAFAGLDGDRDEPAAIEKLARAQKDTVGRSIDADNRTIRRQHDESLQVLMGN